MLRRAGSNRKPRETMSPLPMAAACITSARSIQRRNHRHPRRPSEQRGPALKWPSPRCVRADGDVWRRARLAEAENWLSIVTAWKKAGAGEGGTIDVLKAQAHLAEMQIGLEQAKTAQ